MVTTSRPCVLCFAAFLVAATLPRIANAQPTLDAYQKAVYDSTPLLYYTFDNDSIGSGAVANAMGGAYAGSYVTPSGYANVAAAQGPHGVVGQVPYTTPGADFRDTNAYVSTGLPTSFGADMKNGFTVSFWINTTAAEEYTQVFGVLNPGWMDNMGLVIDLNRPQSERTQFYVRASGGQSVNGVATAPIYNESWHHVAMVVQPQSVLPASYDNYMQVYINGQIAPLTFSGTLTEESTFTDFVSAPFLGALNNRGNAASFANAAIDEFAVFGRPLSQAEIQSHLNAMPQYDFAYDGTYLVNSTVPPLGQTTWRVHNAGMQAINTEGDGTGGSSPKTGYMRINDNAGDNRTAFWQLFDGQDQRPGPVANHPWTYEARLKIDSTTATAGDNTTSFLGVRDEGLGGKQVMLGWQNFQDGETDRVRVAFFSSAGALHETTLLALDADDFFGEYFEYRVAKYWDSGDGEFKVQAYIDDVAVGGVRSWSSFANQLDANNGFGFFSTTAGMIDITFDYVTFAVPEPSAALLLGTALLGLLPWRRRAR